MNNSSSLIKVMKTKILGKENKSFKSLPEEEEMEQNDDTQVEREN